MPERHIGVSSLRVFNGTDLRNLGNTIYFIHYTRTASAMAANERNDARPLAVLISYSHFLQLQDELQTAIKKVSELQRNTNA